MVIWFFVCKGQQPRGRSGLKPFHCTVTAVLPFSHYCWFSPLDSCWEAEALATSTLLLAVHFFLSDVVSCSSVCRSGFLFNSQANCAMMDLAATPSQLSNSIPAMGGCKGCSLPALCWETAPLPQTPRLNNGQGSERASSSVSAKITNTPFATGGSNLQTQKALLCHL